MSTLTGAYAVDALPDSEREQFERHLASCQDCATEVDELRETAARLGADATTTPPETLKQRVLDEITRTRQLPPRTQQPQLKKIAPLRRQSWFTRLAVAAAIIGIAAAGALGGITWNTQQQLADLTEQIARDGDQSSTMTQVLQAPDARILRTSSDGSQATTVASRQQGKAVFLSRNMPAPPPNRVYQLWFIGGTGPTSAGLLTHESGDRTAPAVAAMPTDTAKMALTVEPRGGSPQPTTNPIMMIDIPT